MVPGASRYPGPPNSLSLESPRSNKAGQPGVTALHRCCRPTENVLGSESPVEAFLRTCGRENVSGLGLALYFRHVAFQAGAQAAVVSAEKGVWF